MTDHRKLDRAETRDAELVAYLLDALEPEERAAVEARLSTSSASRRDVRAWTETLARLGEASAVLTSPSDITRARVLAEVRRELDASATDEAAPIDEETAGDDLELELEPDVDEPISRPHLSNFLAIAAAVAALMLGVAALWRMSIADQRLEAYRAERAAEQEQILQLLGETRTRVDGLDEQVGRIDSAVRTMSFPARQSVVLAGLESAPRASGVAHLRSDQQSAVFQAFGLPPLSPERTYQLWSIRTGSPVSAGIFQVDAGGDATVEVGELPPQAEIDAWAVTVEPAGGVPAPTGDMVLRG
ncbi:MAG TPA: anti-sigma factor [Thermoanaerobaculia bacterium]|nr:anti-sigma factor [Thermoanaerobaculia bacterium]